MQQHTTFGFSDTRLESALLMDEQDPLRYFRDKFWIPELGGEGSTIYFVGHSLGPMPRSIPTVMHRHVKGWAEIGVEGHWTEPFNWLPIHRTLTVPLANVAGAKTTEVVAMGTLTANLHHMMASFYNPTPERYRIMIETGAFPSDRYAVVSHIDMVRRKLTPYLGERAELLPENALIEASPRPGEETLRTEDILKTIEEEGDSIALILFSGTNFYTGQAFDMKKITEVGRRKGCVVGFDLAHAIGNVKLRLHDWDVDFACWCSYKYLSSGPGAVGGLFVHERHHNNPDLPVLMGWWSHEEGTRFDMPHKIVPFQDVQKWQLSNPPVFSLVPVQVSLDIFMEAGIDNLIEKSKRLTGYLRFLLESLKSDAFRIITPEQSSEHGAQLSVIFRENGKAVHEAMGRQGVICDWREPNCIRVAPAPLFNRFEEVHRFVSIFARELGLSISE